MDPASFERDEAGCGAIYSSHVSDLHLARSPRSGIDPVVANMNLDQRMILGSASIILYNRPQVFRNRLIALAIGKVTEDHRERFENSYWKESQGIRDSSYSGAQFAKDMDLAHRLSGMDSSYSAAELPREFQGVGESTLESTVPDLGLADLDMQYYRGSVALPQEA